MLTDPVGQKLYILLLVFIYIDILCMKAENALILPE